MASLVFATVATIAAVDWYYLRQRDAIDSATAQELAAISDAQAAQITNWRLERIGDGRVLTSGPVMRIAGRLLANGTASPADRADLADVVRNLERAFLYTGAVLVDRDGNPRLQLDAASGGSPGLWKFAVANAGLVGVGLSDLYRAPDSGRALMALVVPVADRGALLLEIDATRFLYPYLNSWPAARRTGETFLVRIEGNDLLYLSNLRYTPGAAMVRRRSLNEAPLRTAVNAQPGKLTKVRDYRGVDVLGILRPIPDSNWTLATKIDQEEVYKPLKRLAWEMGLLIGLIAIANAAGVGLVWRSKQLRAHREREDWFRKVANDTPAYLWMSSGAEDENSFINKSLAECLGIGADHLGRTWTSYLHPDDASRAQATYLKAVEGRQNYIDEFRLRRFDGEYRWVVNQGVPRFSSNRDFLGYAGALTDITDRNGAEQRLREANAVLARELEERTRTEKQIQALSARLINAQEEERTRVARELHDDLSQQIAAVNIAMSNLKREIPEEHQNARTQAERIQRKLAQLAEGMRRVSHELHPAVLTRAGLGPALRGYCEEFTSLTGIRVTLMTNGSFEGVAIPAALCLYRITQEALRNIAKHADVSEARVELCQSEGVLRLVVSDQGKGMESAQAHPAPGLGLVSIRERTRLLNGRLEIRTQPGEGTTIRVEVPDTSRTG